MKLIIGLFVLLIIIAVGGKFLIDYRENNPDSFNFFNRQDTTKAKINNDTFDIIVAGSNEERQIGLSNRNSLGKNSGMIFAFDKADYYSFWMKNMKFPIDILFIRGDRIITIHKNVQPPKSANDSLPVYNPKEPADKVLELNANVTSEKNIKEGDKIEVNL